MIASLVPRDLLDYFNRIFWPRQLGGRPGTKRLYLQAIARFGEYLQRPAHIDDLHDDAICGFLQSRLENRAAHTVDKEKDKLVALANFAARKRHIDEFPDVPAIPTPDKVPNALRIEQVVALLDACRNVRGCVGEVLASHWWYGYHVVCLLTGERTGAMHALRWEWLKSDGWLPVPGSVRKCRKPQTHYLTPGALRAIEPLRGKTSGLIFAKDFCLGTFYNRNRKILAAAGLPTTRDYQPQISRRTFATWLEASGGDATEALLHSKRSVTTSSYIDPTIATRPPASKLVAQALGIG